MGQQYYIRRSKKDQNKSKGRQDEDGAMEAPGRKCCKKDGIAIGIKDCQDFNCGKGLSV